MKYIPFDKRKRRYGLWFTAPFLVGFVLMYLVPLISSVVYAFSKVSLNENGIQTVFIGLTNFRFAFTEDVDFLKKLTNSLGSMLYQVPLIILFSLFIAIMLNRKFHGRTIVRAIFFIPVIVASGVVINIMNGDIYAALMQEGQNSSSMLESTVLKQMLSVYGVRDDLINAFIGTIDAIFKLAWRCGIQILIFLAALQSVPPSLYESSAIEGANGWENFWFITLPMILPVMIVNCVYTIIDSFTDYNNVLMTYVYGYANKLNYGVFSAMAWTYFAIIAILLLLVFKLINKRAFYSV